MLLAEVLYWCQQRNSKQLRRPLHSCVTQVHHKSPLDFAHPASTAVVTTVMMTVWRTAQSKPARPSFSRHNAASGVLARVIKLLLALGHGHAATVRSPTATTRLFCPTLFASQHTTQAAVHNPPLGSQHQSTLQILREAPPL